MRHSALRKIISSHIAMAGGLLLGLWCTEGPIQAQAQAPSALMRDYSQPASTFPRFYKPYQSLSVPGPDLSNDVPLTVQDGKLRLSMDQLIAAVVKNNLTIASARYYPSVARTDLLRARSGSSPRGVDVSVIPSEVFAGAVGSSILGSAGGAANGASNAGGITGAASQVTVRPAGVFDPTLSLAFSVEHIASPLNSVVVSGVPVVTTGTGVASVNYVQEFSSGTSVAVSYTVQRQGSTQQRLLYDPAFTPGFTATVSQQLLNGFGFKVNRALITVSQNEQKIERESFHQQLVAVLATAENAYWDLISARESVRVAQQAVAVAQRLEENNKKELAAGVMARLDVLTAQSQVAASQRDLIVAQTNLQYAELQLKNMLSKNLDEPLASATIETTDSFPDPEDAQLPLLEQAVTTAKQNRPEIFIAQGNIKSQEDVLAFIKNALLPTFNVFGLMTTVGLYNVFGTSFTEALHFRYPEYAFGVTISFPLHNRQAEADDIRSRLELQQSRETFVRTQNQIAIDVQNALNSATQAKAQVAAARVAVRLEEQDLDAEQKKLAGGLSTPYNVILVQRDLSTAQLAEVQALDTYAKARVTLDQVMGTTLENSHVTLEDALRER